MDKPEPEPDAPLTVSDFHNLVHKQILNAVFASLSESKMEWPLIAPFLDAGRELCRADFQEGAQIRLHAKHAEGVDTGTEENWVEADEAYLEISVADREDGEQWLSESYWLSEIAIADGDRAQVASVVAALERSVAKLKAWLADPNNENAEGGDPTEAGPPSKP